MTLIEANVERSLVVAAPPQRVWETVSDVSRLGELMPEVERYEPVDDGWRWVLVEQQRLGRTFQPRFTVRYELEEPERVRFERVAAPGDSAQAGGLIAVGRSDGERTEASFRLELTVDLPVPGLLRGSVATMLSDEIRRLADGFLTNVRATAE